MLLAGPSGRMNSMRFIRSTLVLATVWTFGLLASESAAGEPPVVAGFNLQRGGVTAVDTDAAWLSQLRAAIATAFPGVEFRGTPTLSSAALSGADLIIITSTFSGGGPISPLSGAEVNALRTFVVGGGSALLFVDADTPAGWEVANESVINAFGMDITGSAGAGTMIDLTIAESPLVTGRFGTTTSVSFTTGGRIDVLGPSALAAGVYPATQDTAIAFIPKGALGIGSGLVAAFGDTTMIIDGFFTPSNRIAVMNAIGEAIQGTCRADFDGSGEIAVPDIFAFFAVWFAGDIASGNYNGDAFLNTDDLFAFLADWFAGC